MRKKLNEEFSPLRNNNPYKIRRDKGFIKDASPQLNQKYLLQRQMEINNFYEGEQMMGELDKLEPLFVDLFKQIIYIKEFIESQKKQPLIKKSQYNTINKIAKMLDKANKIVSVDILDELDKLGAK